MANRYANLVGSNKIKDEYTKINQGFDKVQQDMDAKPDRSIAQVNNVQMGTDDTLTIEGSTGITVTTNPSQKKVTITATGTSTPGAHGPSHNNDGADPIPDLQDLTNAFDAHRAESTNYLGGGLIINGGFDIWQRGTSFENPSSPGYCADRFYFNFNGTGGVRTYSRQAFGAGQTLIPNSPQYFLRYEQTSGGDGITYNNFGQRIENVRKFSGVTVTLSFYARIDNPANAPVLTLIANYGTGGSSPDFYSPATAFAPTTTWQRHEFTFNLPTQAGKTIGSGSYLAFNLNFQDKNAFLFEIDRIKMEIGDRATPFIPKPASEELTACQRYYEKSFNYSVAPMQGSGNFGGVSYARGDGTNYPRFINTSFAVTKRVPPTIQTYNPQAGENNNNARNITSSANVPVATERVGDRSFTLRVNNSPTAAGDDIVVHWTADAEL